MFKKISHMFTSFTVSYTHLTLPTKRMTMMRIMKMSLKKSV